MNTRFRTYLLTVLFVALIIPRIGQAIAVQITATVPGCGDSSIGQGEQCDGTNLGGATCASLGYASGVLACTTVCTQDTSSCSMQSPSGGGGGGGGGSHSATTATVAFMGKSYPGSTVVLLKDGQSVATTIANAAGIFQATLSGISAGNFIFGAYALDAKGVQSPLLGFPVTVGNKAVLKASGISIAPSLYLSSASVKRNEILLLSGNAIPRTALYAVIDKNVGVDLSAPVDKNGNYSARIDTAALTTGTHSLRLYTLDNGDMSGLSRNIDFTISGGGSRGLMSEQPRGCKVSDVNCDGKVNLVDLSILLYWYKNPIPPPGVDLNKDGVVNIVDFSILVYRWTA